MKIHNRLRSNKMILIKEHTKVQKYRSVTIIAKECTGQVDDDGN